MSFWWSILHKLPGIEELELYPASVDILGAAWKVNFAPAVLPALRRIRIVDSQLDPQYYAAIGDPPARRIVRLPSSTEDDVSAEKEIQDMSRGLLRLLRGLGTNLSKKEKQADDGMVPWMILTYLYASGSRCSRQRRVSGLTAHIAT
jgi:hypothetical protein